MQRSSKIGGGGRKGGCVKLQANGRWPAIRPPKLLCWSKTQLQLAAASYRDYLSTYVYIFIVWQLHDAAVPGLWPWTQSRCLVGKEKNFDAIPMLQMSHLCGSLKDLIAFTGEHDDYPSDSVALANLNRPCRLFGWMNMNDKSKLLLPNLLLHVCPICLFNNLFILFSYIHHITSLCICVNHVPSSREFRLVWFPSRRRWPWPLKGLLRSLRRGLIQDHPATNGDHVYIINIYI